MNANFGSYRPGDYAHQSNTLHNMGNRFGDAVASIPGSRRQSQAWKREDDKYAAGEAQKQDVYKALGDIAGQMGIKLDPPHPGESVNDYVDRVDRTIDAAYNKLKGPMKDQFYERLHSAVSQYEGMTRTGVIHDRFQVNQITRGGLLGAGSQDGGGAQPEQGGVGGSTPLDVTSGVLPQGGEQEPYVQRGGHGGGAAHSMSNYTGGGTPLSHVRREPLNPGPPPATLGNTGPAPVAADENTADLQETAAQDTASAPPQNSTGTPMPAIGSSEQNGGVESDMAAQAAQATPAQPAQQPAQSQMLDERLNATTERFRQEQVAELQRRHDEVVDYMNRRLITPRDAMEEIRKIRGDYAAVTKGMTAVEIQRLEQQMAQEQSDFEFRRDFEAKQFGRTPFYLNGEIQHTVNPDNFGSHTLDATLYTQQNAEGQNYQGRGRHSRGGGGGGSGSDDSRERELLSQQIQRTEITRNNLRTKQGRGGLTSTEEEQLSTAERTLAILLRAQGLADEFGLFHNDARRYSSLMGREELAAFLPVLTQNEGMLLSFIEVAKTPNITAREIREGLIYALAPEPAWADTVLRKSPENQDVWVKDLLQRRGLPFDSGRADASSNRRRGR